MCRDYDGPAIFYMSLLVESIYNNRTVKMCGHARGLRGRTGGRRRAQTDCGPE